MVTIKILHVTTKRFLSNRISLLPFKFTGSFNGFNTVHKVVISNRNTAFKPNKSTNAISPTKWLTMKYTGIIPQIAIHAEVEEDLGTNKANIKVTNKPGVMILLTF